MFKKLETPEMAKKLCLVCQVTPSSSQICKEVQKPYCGRDDYLFWMSAQYFFQLPKLNKYCLGAELTPGHQVIIKLNMDHLRVYTLYSTSRRNGYRM